MLPDQQDSFITNKFLCRVEVILQNIKRKKVDILSEDLECVFFLQKSQRGFSKAEFSMAARDTEGAHSSICFSHDIFIGGQVSSVAL